MNTTDIRVGDTVQYRNGPIFGVVLAIWKPQYGVRGERLQIKAQFPSRAVSARADAFRKVEGK